LTFQAAGAVPLPFQIRSREGFTLFSSTMKWSAVGSLVALCVLPGCVTGTRYAQQGDELARTQDELQQHSGQLREAEDALIAAGEEREALAQRAALADQMQTKNAELQALVEKLKQQGAFTTPEGTTVVAYDGMIGYRSQGDVLFSSGSDKLTAEGKKILSSVATELKKNEYPVVVVGHTDSDPVVRTADQWPRGNLQLGAGRALSVLEFLVSQGIPEGRVSLQSYGAHMPVATGNSAEAKKKNRRVEVMLKVAGEKSAH